MPPNWARRHDGRPRTTAGRTIRSHVGPGATCPPTIRCSRLALACRRLDGIEFLCEVEKQFGVHIKDLDWWVYETPTLAAHRRVSHRALEAAAPRGLTGLDRTAIGRSAVDCPAYISRPDSTARSRGHRDGLGCGVAAGNGQLRWPLSSPVPCRRSTGTASRRLHVGGLRSGVVGFEVSSRAVVAASTSRLAAGRWSTAAASCPARPAVAAACIARLNTGSKLIMSARSTASGRTTVRSRQLLLHVGHKLQILDGRGQIGGFTLVRSFKSMS